MKTDKEIDKLKQDIEAKREELNKILIEDRDKEKVLIFSQELDVLISRYYSLRLG